MLPPMSPITPGRQSCTGSVHAAEDLEGLIRQSLSEDVECYQQENMVQISQEEANKLRDQVLSTFEEVKSKHELVTHLSERLRHIYSSSFLTDSLSGSLGSSVAAPTPDISSIPHNHPILSPLAIDAQYMERAEKEIARLESVNAEKCKEIEDLVFQMESMRSLHEADREKFRNERVALKSEIVELSVAVRGLRQNNRVAELELEVKRLKAKNYELIAMVNAGMEKSKNNARVCIGITTEPDEEQLRLVAESGRLRIRLDEAIRERDEFERISRLYTSRELVNVSTWTEKSFLRCNTRDVGSMTPMKTSDMSTVCSLYSVVMPGVVLVSSSSQTTDSGDSESFDGRILQMEAMENELELRTTRIGELVAERKALYRTIEDLEDEVSALRENIGMVLLSKNQTVDQGIECDLWNSDMREKYDKYKRQLLEATKRLREIRERQDGRTNVCVMTELSGEIFDNVIEELQKERDMYRLRLQEILATKKRECWSQTPEKKKEVTIPAAAPVPFKLEEFFEIATQTIAECEGKPSTVSRGVLVDETSGIINELAENVKRNEEYISQIQFELNGKISEINKLEKIQKESEKNLSHKISELVADKIGLEEEICRLRAELKAGDLSEIIKPIQEKLVVAPSMSTCSPPSGTIGGLFDYSHSTIHNQLQQTLSSFSPLRLEMSTPQEVVQGTPRDKDGDIMMMTVARAKKDDENIAPLNGEERQKQPAIDLALVLRGVRDKAAVVSMLSDRISYLSSLA